VKLLKNGQISTEADHEQVNQILGITTGKTTSQTVSKPSVSKPKKKVQVKGKTSEFRAYPWITKRLKQKGWNTLNPNTNPLGEVWTQQECLEDAQIQAALQAQRPENVIKITSTDFWVVEAKKGIAALDQACNEAKAYADLINKKSSSISHIATGVAGDEESGFEARHHICINGKWERIVVEKKTATGFLTKQEVNRLIAQKTSNLVRDEISQRELIFLANSINDQLHLAKITKEDRAILVAILLIALHQDPSLKKGDPAIFLKNINARAEVIFKASHKEELWEKVKITFTAAQAPLIAEALSQIVQLLRDADLIDSLDKSDVLGPFFESFLRYGNTSKDLGIVLTPRHICWLAVEALGICDTDFIYDPAAGTGGFLIAAFNRIGAISDASKAKAFADQKIYGAEAGSHIAALAFVNMYFRGDGKHNMSFDSCFENNMNKIGKGLKLKFVPKLSESEKQKKPSPLGVTRVLMNPPFSLKDSKEKEPDFIDHALNQMVEGGLLFAILPASVFYESKHDAWRKRLLEQNTLVASISFPIDVFYPVATDSIAVILKKGTPHDAIRKVMWVRINDDGFTKSKGFRVEKKGVDYKTHLKIFADSLREWALFNRETSVEVGVREFSVISDGELIPQAQLGTGTVDPVSFKDEVNKLVKGMTAQMWEQDERLNNVVEENNEKNI